jgi:hypothetical protein
MVQTESSNERLQNFNKELHLDPHPAPVKIRRHLPNPIPLPNWLIIP